MIDLTIGEGAISGEEGDYRTQVEVVRVTLESSARPVFIQVDPAFRVPQVNLDNNT